MIFVFNPTAAQARYFVNGSVLMPVGPWGSLKATTAGARAEHGYVPHGVVAEFRRHSAPGYFGRVERNRFRVELSYRDSGYDLLSEYEIDLSGSLISIDDDYMIYAFRDRIWVMDARGHLVGSINALVSRDI